MAPSVLLCLLARGRQNHNHFLTLVLQPGADRWVLSAVAGPSSGEPSPGFFDTLGSFCLGVAKWARSPQLQALTAPCPGASCPGRDLIEGVADNAS